MADEVKDQSPETGKSSLPERDFFSGDKMDRFIEEQELFKEEQAAPPKAEAAPAKKPCPGCPPDEKPQATPETRKPLRVLKVDGKDYPIYSEKDLDDLAQKGAHYTQERQKDSKWEKSLGEREDKFSQAVENLSRLAQTLETRGQQPPPNGRDVEEPKEEEPDYDAIDDPAVRTVLKKLSDENRALKQDVQMAKGVTQNVTAEKMKTELDQVLAGARERHPFEEIKDEESGENITQGIFAGLLSYKVNRDRMLMSQDPKRSLKPVHEYIEETARDLNRLESRFKGNIKREAGLESDKVTVDLMLDKFPDVADEIGQRAVAEYLRKLDAAPPVAKSRSEDTLRKRDSLRKPGEFTSIDDALAAALKDTVISEGLDEAQRKSRQYK